MKSKNFFFLYVFLVSVLTMPLAASTVITPEMKAGAEIVIKSCEKSYQDTGKLRDKFDKIKKPSFIYY
jgi:hypothetical protein